MFFTLNYHEVASYADNTPYITCDTIESMTASLEKMAKEIFKWFKDNKMHINVMFL